MPSNQWAVVVGRALPNEELNSTLVTDNLLLYQSGAAEPAFRS